MGFYRVVIGLCPTAGKKNFLRSAADHISDLSTAGNKGLFRFYAVPVSTGRVAEFGFEEKGRIASITSGACGVVPL